MEKSSSASKFKLDMLSDNSNTTLFLSCLLHAIILFTILTVLFLCLISKLAGDAFKKTLNRSLDSTIPQALKSNDKNGLFKQFLKNLPLDNLKTLYSVPEPVTQAKNEGVRNIMIFCVVFGIVGFFGSCLLLYLSCGKVIPFTFIFVENLAIFTFVGLFEVYFFLSIGKKYVPVPPSFLINRLYSNIKTM
jgi:hypothetical protein